jgi:AraC family transcriptional regulator
MTPKRSAEICRRRVHRVMDHISEHLDQALPLEELAQLAHFFPFHFHRVLRSVAGEPGHALIRRLRLERAVHAMAHGPRESLTSIALRCGFSSSSDFSRAFKQASGFSPRSYSRDAFLEKSKIRQDLLANAGYGLGALPGPENPDRFRVRVRPRGATRFAYVRVIGGFRPEKILAGYHKLIDWGQRRGLVPGATLIGMSLDDPDITPMVKYRFDWCLVLPDGVSAIDEVNTALIPAGRFAELHWRGDIQKVDRAWRHLFHAWLPRSGFEPREGPAMEVFRSYATSTDHWAEFDLDCCVPVRPLRAR